MSTNLDVNVQARNEGIATGVRALRDQVTTIERSAKHLLYATGLDESQDAEHLEKTLKLAITLLSGLADRVQYGNDL